MYTKQIRTNNCDEVRIANKTIRPTSSRLHTQQGDECVPTFVLKKRVERTEIVTRLTSVTEMHIYICVCTQCIQSYFAFKSVCVLAVGFKT